MCKKKKQEYTITEGRKAVINAIKQGEKYIGRTYEVDYSLKESNCHDK